MRIGQLWYRTTLNLMTNLMDAGPNTNSSPGHSGTKPCGWICAGRIASEPDGHRFLINIVGPLVDHTTILLKLEVLYGLFKFN